MRGHKSHFLSKKYFQWLNKELSHTVKYISQTRLLLKTNIWFFFFIKNIFLGVALKSVVSHLSIRSKNNCTNFGLFRAFFKKRKEIE